MVKVRAPGKVILIGEHSVVYDKLGIAGALEKFVEVEVTAGEKGINIIRDLEYPSFSKTKEEAVELLNKFRELYEEKNFDEIKKLKFKDAIIIVAAETLDRYGYKDVDIAISLKRSLQGVGQSASIFSGIAMGIAKLLGTDLSREETAEIAYIGDVVAHGGTPSGIDTNTVIYGGYVQYKKSDGVKKLDIDFQIPLVVVNSGGPGATAKTVLHVRKQREENPEFVNEILDNLDQIAKWALESLENKDSEKLGQLMYDFYDELRKLDVSTPELDKIVEIARENKFLGAKPTGGWGGGVAIVLARDQNELEKINKVYKDNGFDTLVAGIGAEGIKVVEWENLLKN